MVGALWWAGCQKRACYARYKNKLKHATVRPNVKKHQKACINDRPSGFRPAFSMKVPCGQGPAVILQLIWYGAFIGRTWRESGWWRDKNFATSSRTQNLSQINSNGRSTRYVHNTSRVRFLSINRTRCGYKTLGIRM